MVVKFLQPVSCSDYIYQKIGKPSHFKQTTTKDSPSVFKSLIQIMVHSVMIYEARLSKHKENILRSIINKTKKDCALMIEIEEAQKRLESQIEKIGLILIKIKDKEKFTFKKALEAKRFENDAYLQAHATELDNIRLMHDMVMNAKSALEQLRSRLDTIYFLESSIANGVCLMGYDFRQSVKRDGPLANCDMKELGRFLEIIMRGEYPSNKEQWTKRESPTEAEIIVIVEEIKAVFEERACHIT